MATDSQAFLYPAPDPEWAEVRQWAKSKIEMHRRKLEEPGLPHSETEGARYAIAELRALLNLGKPSKMQFDEPSD